MSPARDRDPLSALEPIEQTWIRNYVDQLLELAGKLADGAMKEATLRRADAVLDLVKAWRERA